MSNKPVVTITPDRLHEEIALAKERYDQAEAHLNELLNTCQEDGGECSKCAVICCPYKDDLHFHHDGCPSCASANGEKDQLNSYAPHPPHR